MTAGVWRTAQAEDGSIYYYNVLTNETTWDLPEGETVVEDQVAVFQPDQYDRYQQYQQQQQQYHTGARFEDDEGEQEGPPEAKRQRLEAEEANEDAFVARSVPEEQARPADAPSITAEEQKRRAFNEFLATPDSNAVKVNLLLGLLSFGKQLRARKAEAKEAKEEPVFVLPATRDNDEVVQVLVEKLSGRIRERFNVAVTNELCKRFDIHVPPPWLKEFLQEESARELIVSLSEEYPRSQFLKYCLEKLHNSQ